MSSRISDVHSKTFVGAGTPSANARIQLDELPTPTCWLRGVTFNTLYNATVTAGGSRFDFVTSSTGSDPPDQSEVLISFPINFIYGSMSFLLPEDSYIEIVDSGLWVTSSDADAIGLNSYHITLYYT